MAKRGRKPSPASAPVGKVKSCRDCGAEKDLSEFYARGRAKDGRSTYCKVCDCKHACAWAKANPERVNARNKAFRDKDLERARRYQRAYHFRYPERHAQRVREYRAKNPEWTLEQRRARRRKVKPLDVALIDARFDVFGHRCAYCGSADKLTIDHVISIKRGGRHIPANIRPACLSCNSSKGAKPLKDWLASGSAAVRIGA